MSNAVNVSHAVQEAVTALYLYDMSRGPRGCFYDIVKALDYDKFMELCEHGPDWVYDKYYSEED